MPVNELSTLISKIFLNLSLNKKKINYDYSFLTENLVLF